MRINTNIASLNAQENATNTNKSLTSSLEKLSSGLAINKAADDASGLAIADKLRTQASSIGQGIANANSASALIQIADKAMAEQSNILDIVKQKLIQASTSTTNADGREAIRKDISKLLDQFDNIAAQTNYNGTTLLQKSATDTDRQDKLSFQLGEDSTFDVEVQSSKASNTNNLGGGSDTVFSAATGAVATGATYAADNNIGVGGSKQIKTDGSITIADVDIAAAGTESVGTVNALDVEVSGVIGSFQAVAQDVTIDLSSQTTDIQNAVKAIAAQTGAVLTDNGDNTFTVASGDIVDFGDIDFSGADFTSAAVAGSMVFNSDSGATVDVTISDNNVPAGTPLLGQINVELSSTGTGGQLLSDLKNLAADGLTSDKANSFMTTIDEALSQLNANRSDYGSTQNQLQSSVRNMQTTQTNLNAAESVIRDVDYAAESANFNKQNIIAQAGTYAMSQANAMQQNVMRLLQ